MAGKETDRNTLETEVAILSERVSRLLDSVDGENGFFKRVEKIENAQSLCLQRQKDREKNKKNQTGILCWILDNAIVLFASVLSSVTTFLLLYVSGNLTIKGF